jgi:hypothetical protein
MNYKCNKCNKSYKHRQSLFRHKNKCNNTNIKYDNSDIKICDDVSLKMCSPNVASAYKICSPNIASAYKMCSPNVAHVSLHVNNDKQILDCNENINKNSNYIKVYKCKYCNDEFKHSSSKYRHQNKCSNRNDNTIDNINDIEDIDRDIDREIKRLKKDLLDMLNKTYKVHPKTFKKIKQNLNELNEIKALSNNNNINNFTNNTTNNNIQNIQNNSGTINIIPLGKEEFVNNLDKQSQIDVVNSLYGSIKHLCNITHFNPDTPQYHSFAITNTQNNIGYSYDNNRKIYKSVSKIELIEELIHERTNDIREFMEYNINELNPKIIKRLNGFIDKLDTNRLYLKKKCNELKTIVYDNTKHIDINKLNLLHLESLSNNTT